MKKSDIDLGRSYADTQGDVRQVRRRALPPLISLRTMQADNDCVRYRVLARRGVPVKEFEVEEHICTRKAFARWAKTEVTS